MVEVLIGYVINHSVSYLTGPGVATKVGIIKMALTIKADDLPIAPVKIQGYAQ